MDLKVLFLLSVPFLMIFGGDSFSQSEQFCGRDISDFDTVIDGTPGDDKGKKNKLVGTNHDDLIRGFGGNDELEGKDGNDCLIGGDGEDKMDGGKHNDTCVIDEDDPSPKKCEVIDGGIINPPETPNKKPGKVESLSGTSDDSQVSLTWSAPTDGGTVGWYKIDYKEEGGKMQHIDNLDASLQDYVVTGLTNGVEYEFKVQAKNDKGDGKWSDKLFLTPVGEGGVNPPTPDEKPPPTNLRGAIEGRDLTLQWDAPKVDSDSESQVLDYILVYSTENGKWVGYDDGISTETELRVSNIQEDTEAEIRTYAEYPTGLSESSNVITITSKSEEIKISKGSGSASIPPPRILGAGIYQIVPSSESTSDREDVVFEDYFPYSTNTYDTDSENYDSLGSFYKTGRFYDLKEDYSKFPTITGKVNQPMQFQFQILDPENRSPLHAALYFNINKIMSMNESDTFVSYDRNNEEKITINDPNKFIKDATVSVSLEDNRFWVTFDITFEKSLEKSGGIFEIWNDGRHPIFQISKRGAIEIVDTFEPKDDSIGLFSKVGIVLGASSPGCQEDSPCFEPFSTEILKGGVITWENQDSFSHILKLGTPNEKTSFGFEEILSPNEEFSFKFEIPRTYQYYSMNYPWATGEIIVQDTLDSLKKETVVETYQEHQKNIAEDSERNVSGTLILDELIDYPIKLESKASGKTKIIYDKDIVVLPQKDLRMEISGNVFHITNKQNKIDLVVLRPDNTIKEMSFKVNADGEYGSPLTLHSKWVKGTYAMIATIGKTEVGRTSFFITNEVSSFGALKGESTDSLDVITQYLDLEISESELFTQLGNLGWSDEKIQDFIEKNPLPNPYSSYIVIAILLLLLVIITTILSPKRN